LEYLERTRAFLSEENSEKSFSKWQPASAMRVEVADFINMSHHLGVAEISLASYSLNGATMWHNSGEQGQFKATGLALLRSHLRVQQQLIEALYVQ